VNIKTTSANEQPPIQQQHPFSVKIEPDPKGFYKTSVHVYGDDLEDVKKKSVQLLKGKIDELRANGLKVIE
jgi:hypothetical protein